MWRGLWLAALHDHSIMASSAPARSYSAAVWPSLSPFSAGFLALNADLIPCNIIRFKARTGRLTAAVRWGPYSDILTSRAHPQGALRDAART
jgi:hypothetical protein